MINKSGEAGSRKIIQALKDITTHGDAAARLVLRGKDSYLNDEFLRFAAEDLIIRLGEAVARIDSSDSHFIEQHKDLELRKLKDSRNVIAHGYDIVDYEIIWEILSIDIPRVIIKVQNFLAEYPDDYKFVSGQVIR